MISQLSVDESTQGLLTIPGIEPITACALTGEMDDDLHSACGLHGGIYLFNVRCKGECAFVTSGVAVQLPSRRVRVLR